MFQYGIAAHDVYLRAKSATNNEMEEGKALFSDADLLAQYVRERNGRALGELYERYLPMIYGVCLRYLRDADNAADAVMAIFEETALRVGQYQVQEFRPWIYTVTKNYCLQQLRSRRQEVPFDMAERVGECSEVTVWLDDKSEGDRMAQLEACMEKLPEKQRECLVGFFWDGKSYADIAAETRYPLASVKSFLQNGKRNLKLCVERNGHETD